MRTVGCNVACCVIVGIPNASLFKLKFKNKRKWCSDLVTWLLTSFYFFIFYISPVWNTITF
uniref:Uncharacterized protein n=1 Tax=Anguilla anguilla TaxID=7936 RepID=A0A0E9SZD4_ANGAN